MSFNNQQDQSQITHIYHWSNNVVIVLDQYGRPMPEYSGPLQDVREKITRDYHGLWMQGNWSTGTILLIVSDEKLMAF